MIDKFGQVVNNETEAMIINQPNIGYWTDWFQDEGSTNSNKRFV